MADAPQTNPGEIMGWPMLQFVYRTDPDKLAALLPPGIDPGAEPRVNITVYNYPVPDEPELGVLTTVDADFEGVAGQYALGYGINQESAIFNSQQMNGQPKYPCDIQYYRFGDRVTARCTHQGYTFLKFQGEVTGVASEEDTREVNEWWIKVSRAVGVMPVGDEYDFPPSVVRVKSTYGTAYKETLNGTLELLPSPWDPLAELLPMHEQLSADLWTPTFLGREVFHAGKLDPVAFLPYLDVIGGSRWPGTFGGPKREL